MPDESRNRPPTLHSGRDSTISGDVAGRDKTVTTTTITEGGPVARYAVIGLSLIAALAIVVVAVIAALGSLPFLPVTGPTPTFTATLTLTPSASPTPTATSTPTLTPTRSRTATPTVTPSPPPTATTASPTPSATDTLPPEVTPLPISTLPLYDDFNDACLASDRWRLDSLPAQIDGPTPTASPTDDKCLAAEAFGFTEGVNGRLSVFLSLEGDETHSVSEAGGGCYREAEVTVMLREVTIVDGRHDNFLRVALTIQQVTRAARLEVRLRAGNEVGPLQYRLLPRLIVADGYTDVLPALIYRPGQPITLAFRVTDVGAFNLATGTTSIGKVLTIYANDVALTPSYSLRGYPCDLTLGYHAEQQTSLEGYFDEVRFIRAP